MKKILLLLIFLSSAGVAELPVEVQARSAIVINADTGKIIFEKNAHQLMFPASLTKVATAAYALKLRGHKLDTMIAAEHDAVASISEEAKKRSNYTLPSHWLTPGTSHIGIKKGEVLSLEDLLYGILLASGGDASNVVAQHIGGTVPQYMQMMNEWFRELGCTKTHFNNPHGLHHPKHVTTAFEMAKITQEAMRDPKFREIVATIRHPRPKTNKQEATNLFQSNRLVKKGKWHYPRAIGVKTGFTSAAGYNLAAAATEDDRTLIAIMLGCPNRDDPFDDAILLFDWAFMEKKVERLLVKEGKQKHTLSLEGASSNLETYTVEPIKIAYYPSERPELKCTLCWEDELELPIAKDQKVGEMRVRDDEGHVLHIEPLYAVDAVKEKRIPKPMILAMFVLVALLFVQRKLR